METRGNRSGRGPVGETARRRRGDGLARWLPSIALFFAAALAARAGNVANGDFQASGTINWSLSSSDTSKVASYSISVGRITKVSNFRLIGGSQPSVILAASQQSFSLLDGNASSFRYIRLGWGVAAVLSGRGSSLTGFSDSGSTYSATTNSNFSGTYNVGVLITDETGVISYYGAVRQVTFTNGGGSTGGSGAGTTTAGRLSLFGSTAWSIRSPRITISADRIVNSRNGGRSGSLRLSVWATTSRYRGGTLRGRIIGVYGMKPLAGNAYRPNVRGTVPYRRPPRGKYYTTLTLTEYTSAGWVIRDYRNFPRRVTLGAR